MASANGFAAPWLEFEKELGFRPRLHGPTEKECFEGWLQIGGAIMSKYELPPVDKSVGTQDKEIENGLKVRIYTPPQFKDDRPVGMYIHGGGWTMGDLDMDDAWCRIIAKNVNTVIVSVDYRLAPQFKHPTQVDDCYHGCLWALKNANELGAAVGKLWTIGVSAGGHLALATALKLIDEGYGDALKGVVAQIPFTVHPDAVPQTLMSRYTAYDDHAEDTVNTKSAMMAFLNALGGSPADKYLSVLLHENLGKLPKAYISCTTHDTLYDDARLLKRLLDEKGVPNMYEEFKGYPHFFWSYPSKSLDGPRAKYMSKLVDGINFILS